MAIYRLNGSNDTSVTSLVSFLNANKAGTFLADATIEESTTKFSVDEAQYGNTLKITKGNTVLEVGYCQYTSNISHGAHPMAKLSTIAPAATIKTVSLTPGDYGGKFLRGPVILCSHGIIFTEKTYYVTTPTGDRVPFAAFDDGNGGIGLIGGNLTGKTSGTVDIPTSISYITDGSFNAAITISPYYNIQATNLVPCTFVSDGDFVVSDCLHLALQTQWTSGTDTADSVHGNGVDYIANGIIYILDE